jgi:hypothetical protein
MANNSDYTIKFDRTDKAKINRLFRQLKRQSTPILRQAINRGVNGSKVDFTKAAAERLYTAQKNIKKTIGAKQAKGRNLSGWVKADKKQIPAGKFRTRQTKAGVTAKMWRDKSPVKFRGAIKIEIQHPEGGKFKGVLRRKKYFQHQTGIKRNIQYAKLPKKYRYPLEQMFGPTAFHAIKDRKTLDSLKEKGLERYRKELVSGLNRLLRKRAGK